MGEMAPFAATVGEELAFRYEVKLAVSHIAIAADNTVTVAFK